MIVPDGSRREKGNEISEAHPPSAECSEVHVYADESAGSGIRNARGCGGGCADCGGEDRGDARSGVWLATRDGTVLFHPVSEDESGDLRHQSPGAVSEKAEGEEEEAEDEETLEAARRLMPLLPRELIAEYLRLGPYRGDGGSF